MGDGSPERRQSRARRLLENSYMVRWDFKNPPRTERLEVAAIVAAREVFERDHGHELERWHVREVEPGIVVGVRLTGY